MLPPRNGETPGDPGRRRPTIPPSMICSVAHACLRSLARPPSVARRRCAL